MSKRETPMIERYWTSVGGTLVEEFMLVARAPGIARRPIDAVILPHGEARRFDLGGRRAVVIAGQDVVLVQAKANRLGLVLRCSLFRTRDTVGSLPC